LKELFAFVTLLEAAFVLDCRSTLKWNRFQRETRRLFGIVLAEANYLLFQRFRALASWRSLLCSADCSDIPIGASVYLGLKPGFEIALRI
jgi:hypothetical protein